MRYQRPSVLTLDAATVVEAMGPAQGYSGGNPTPSNSLDVPGRLNGTKS